MSPDTPAPTHLVRRAGRRLQLPFGHQHRVDLRRHGRGRIQRSRGRRGALGPGHGGAAIAAPAGERAPGQRRRAGEEEIGCRAGLVPFAAAPRKRQREREALPREAPGPPEPPRPRLTRPRPPRPAALRRPPTWPTRLPAVTSGPAPAAPRRFRPLPWGRRGAGSDGRGTASDGRGKGPQRSPGPTALCYCHYPKWYAIFPK